MWYHWFHLSFQTKIKEATRRYPARDIFTSRKQKLWEGNVFTHVRLTTGGYVFPQCYRSARFPQKADPSSKGRTHPPPKETTPLPQKVDPSTDIVNCCVVRILLECILVSNSDASFTFCALLQTFDIKAR